MRRKRLLSIAAIASLLVLLTGLVIPVSFSLRSPASAQIEKQTAMNLGISYLPITPALSREHNLGFDSGALVTEVIPGSPADRGGLKVGDVIIKFNGAVIGERVSLLSMMMSANKQVTLEFCREKSIQTVELVCN
jgi:S1-C subfamily serine protease